MMSAVVKQLLLVKHPFQKTVFFVCKSTTTNKDFQTNSVPSVVWPPKRCISSSDRIGRSLYSIPPSSFSYRKDDEVVKEEDDLSLNISVELDIDTDEVVDSEKNEKQLLYYVSDSSASDKGFDW
jgi:hypothetical protein